MRLVVFGWGNDARGDDGLGPLLLARVAASGWPEVTTIEDFQLQIEHALDIADCDAVLFLDAGRDTPAPFSFRRIGPSRDLTHTTHALSPQSLLDVYARIKGVAPPPAFALCVRGDRFELGEALSLKGAARLEEAWEFAQALMGARSLEAWDAAARRDERGHRPAVPARSAPRHRVG